MVVYLQTKHVSIMSEVIRIEVLGCDIVNLTNPLIIHFPVNNYTNHSTVSIPFQMFSKYPTICDNLFILFCVDIHRKASFIPVNTMMNKVGGKQSDSSLKNEISVTHPRVVLNLCCYFVCGTQKKNL